MTLEIRPATEADWPAIARIHQEGIDTGHATFATAPAASWAEFVDGKIAGCSLVARIDGTVVGWATLSPTSKRAVYAGVAELSIYVAASAVGQGVGDRLMRALIATSEARGIWTLVAGIFPENTSSLRLHAKHGFRTLGRRERIGRMTYGPLAGRWRDTLLLERRSAIAGQDELSLQTYPPPAQGDET
jgi:phosphinothricin acetyltransferase